LVFQSKREEEARNDEYQEEEIDEAAVLQEKILQEEKVERERVERTEKLFRPIPNSWNAEVLDYMADFQTSEIADTQMQIHPDPEIKNNSVQDELEMLWLKLHMPLDQKLDMAIKYGSHKKLDMAIKYGSQPSQLETVLSFLT
jgi:hypothetical protein